MEEETPPIVGGNTSGGIRASRYMSGLYDLDALPEALRIPLEDIDTDLTQGPGGGDGSISNTIAVLDDETVQGIVRRILALNQLVIEEHMRRDIARP